MITKLLFGVHNSPERTAMVMLSLVLTIIGVAVMIRQGSEDGLSGVLLGLAFTLVGLASIAIVARVFAVRDEKVATSEQLGKLSGDYSPDALKQMVSQAPHDPNNELGKVTGRLDGAEIQAVVDQVRRDSSGT